MIKIIHPYAVNSKDVTVKFEGETFNGKPHGLCFLSFDEEE